jgi:hypothetical protein
MLEATLLLAMALIPTILMSPIGMTLIGMTLIGLLIVRFEVAVRGCAVALRLATPLGCAIT